MSQTEQIHTLKFKPALFAYGPHLQTILGSFGKSHPIIFPSTTHLIQLQDGDKIVCEESTPPHWKQHHPTTILVHGIAGSHNSRYMLRMARHLLEHGHRTIRVCLRGCGASSSLCIRPYHGGQSEDILSVIQKFHVAQSPTVLIGYSLGANIALKLAGELGQHIHPILKSIVAVCPPFDLNKTVDKIVGMPFRFYERYFMTRLRGQYKTWAAQHPQLKPPKMPRGIGLVGFDDFHTAPRWNFKNARDYYTSCSSKHFIPHIQLPCDIICTMDDPIVDTETVHELHLPKEIKVWKLTRGGHMGFLGNPVHQNGTRWLENFLVDLIHKRLENNN